MSFNWLNWTREFRIDESKRFVEDFSSKYDAWNSTRGVPGTARILSLIMELDTFFDTA